MKAKFNTVRALKKLMSFALIFALLALNVPTFADEGQDTYALNLFVLPEEESYTYGYITAEVDGVQVANTFVFNPDGTYQLATVGQIEAGKTVTLIMHPNVGYCVAAEGVLAQTGATTSSAIAVEPIAGESNQYSFVMPANAVYAMATFSTCELELGDPHAVDFDVDGEQGGARVLVDGENVANSFIVLDWETFEYESASGGAIRANQLAEVVPIAYAGFAADEVNLFYFEDPDEAATVVPVAKNDEGKYLFMMPDFDCYISVTFKAAGPQQLGLMVADDRYDIGYVTAEVGGEQVAASQRFEYAAGATAPEVIGMQIGEVLPGEKINIIGHPMPDYDNFVLSKVQYYDTSLGWSAPPIDAVADQDGVFSFAMPPAMCRVVATFDRPIAEGQKRVNMSFSDADFVDRMALLDESGQAIDPDAWPNGAVPGETFTIRVKGLDDKTVCNDVVVNAPALDDPEIAVTQDESARKGGYSEWSFVMPDAAVDVVLDVGYLLTNYQVTTEPEDFTDHVRRTTYRGDRTLDMTSVFSSDLYFGLARQIDDKYYNHVIELSSNDDTWPLPTPKFVRYTEDEAIYEWHDYYVEDATVHVTFNEVAGYAITNEIDLAPEQASFSVDCGTIAAAGETVALRLKTKYEDGWFWREGVTPLIKQATGQGDPLQLDIAIDDDRLAWGEVVYEFAMPAEAIVIALPEGGLLEHYETVDVTVDPAIADYIELPLPLLAGQNVVINAQQPAADQPQLRYIEIKGDGPASYARVRPSDQQIRFSVPHCEAIVISGSTESTWRDPGNFNEDLYDQLRTAEPDESTEIAIFTAEDLAAVNKLMTNHSFSLRNQTIKLVNDIDMSAHLWVPAYLDGDEDQPTQTVFDGNGHSISGIRIDGNRDSDYLDKVAFFAALRGATVKNLTLSGEIVAHGGGKVGMLSAEAMQGSIVENCDVDFDVVIDGRSATAWLKYVAPLGMISNATARNNHFGGTVTFKDAFLVGDQKIAGINVDMGSNSNSDVVENNYVDTTYLLEDTVKAKQLTFSGLAECAEVGFNNNYFGGSLTNQAVLQNSSIIGTFSEFSMAAGGHLQPGVSYSYLTPLVPDGVTSDNCKAVTSDDKVGAQDLVDLLNAWVSYHQVDQKYKMWQADDSGRPVFRGEDVVVSKHAITTEVIGEALGVFAVPNSAAAGALVEVTARPNTFNKIESIEVFKTAQPQWKIYVNAADYGTYQFDMPNAPVTVKITFKADGYPIAQNVTGQGNLTIVGKTAGASDKAKTGETVEITLDADVANHYANGDVSVTTESGQQVALTAGDNANQWLFTMPSEAVTVNVDYKKVDFFAADGAPVPGRYRLEIELGSQCDAASGVVEGAMGFAPVIGQMDFTVNGDGTMTINEMDAGVIANPLGFVGLSDVKFAGQLYGDNNGDGVLKGAYDIPDGDTFEAGPDSNAYPVGIAVDDVTKWVDIVMQSGAKTPYQGPVYLTDVFDPEKDKVIGKIYTKRELGQINNPGFGGISDQIFPDKMSFDLPFVIKNTDDVADSVIFACVFAAQMGYYPTVLYKANFATIEEVDGTVIDDDDDAVTVDVALYRGMGNAPGGRNKMPMGQDVLLPQAELKGDKLTIDLGTTRVASLWGHLCSLSLFDQATVQSAYEALSDLNAAIELTPNKWFSATVNSDQMTPYQGAVHRMTTAGGAIYYTSDGVKAKFDGTDQNLIYPQQFTITVPAYFDRGDAANYNNEIYLQSFIDGMATETSSGTRLKLVVGEDNQGSQENSLEALIGRVTEAKQLKAADYTAESWNALQLRIAESQALINAASDDQLAINSALAALNAAIAALQLADDTTPNDDTPNDDTPGDDTSQPEYNAGMMLQPKNLAAGSYLVPIVLHKFVNEAEPSMGNAAVAGKAKLLVKADGTQSLSFVLRQLDFMGIKGNLLNMWYYRPAKNPLPPSEYALLGNAQAFSVLKTEKIDGNAEGAKIDRPTYVSMPLSDRQPRQYVAVSVDAMQGDGTLNGATQDAVLLLDYAMLEKAGGQVDEPGTDEPGTDEPGTDEPGTDEPGTDEPGTDEPGTDEPGTDEPGSDEPGTTEPGTPNPNPDDDDSSEDAVTYYHVPVNMERAFGSGDSMANAALTKTALVTQRVGQFTYKVNFKPIKRDFSGQTLDGRLTKLFYYDGEEKKPAFDEGAGDWSFDMKTRLDRIKVAVWVDVMDEIAGGNPGDGEQDAYLIFDWSEAVELAEDDDFEIKDDDDDDGVEESADTESSNAKQNAVNTALPSRQAMTNLLPPLRDVAKGHWAREAVDYVLSKGYFKGTDRGNFEPNRPVSRAQFITVLARVAQVDRNQYQGSRFNDVAADNYYAGYINWAQRVGLVKGVGGGKFEPNRTLTRQEMATILLRYIELEKLELSKVSALRYNDETAIANWAKAAVQSLTEMGVIKGMTNGSFAPLSKLNRAQVAQILYNLLVR